MRLYYIFFHEGDFDVGRLPAQNLRIRKMKGLAVVLGASLRWVFDSPIRTRSLLQLVLPANVLAW